MTADKSARACTVEQVGCRTHLPKLWKLLERQSHCEPHDLTDKSLIVA